jgi:hypothetical protein
VPSRARKLQELLDEQAAEILRLEDHGGQLASAAYRQTVATMVNDLTRRWIMTVGATGETPTEAQALIIRLWLLDRIDAFSGKAPDLTPLAFQAMAMGVRHAGGQLDVGDPASSNEPLTPDRLPADLRLALKGVADSEARQLARARAVLAQPMSYEVAQAATATAANTANVVEGSARWIVNRGVSAGVQKAAKAQQLQTVWRAERDGCVHCMAYSGRVDRGNGWPTGLTYGDKPLAQPGDTLPAPPLHPRCRCQLSVWSDDWASGSLTLPVALEREARRSIVKGWALESESDPARRRAAARLLARDPGLPRTVEERARRAVRTRKRFRRPVP